MSAPGNLLALWLGLCCVTLSFSADINSLCTTPRSQPGVCIPLPDCSELNALLLQPRPLPTASVQLLRSSQCGYLNRQPLVCCRTSPQQPSTPVPNTTPTTAKTSLRLQPESVPAPIDVSQHQNVRLINSELCGQTSAIRIVGGNKTGVTEFPWMVLLKYRSTIGGKTTESFKCGGSLISSRYILTAAHCISNTNKLKLISVRLGEHDTSTEQDCEVIADVRVCASPYQDINVESFIRHPSYNARTYINDIALIRLAQPADTTKENVEKICLPVGLDEQTRNLDGRKLIVAGWGFTETGLASTELLKVSLPVMPVEQCHNVFSGQFGYSINGRQLCAGGTNLKQDSCRGDSGGPLTTFSLVNSVASMVQYGVVSYGHRQCGTAGVPGVYTRVGHYMDWILNNIRP